MCDGEGTQLVKQHHGPRARVGLRAVDLPLLVVPRPRDPQDGRVEINVGPAQCAQLAYPQAGEEQRRPEGLIIDWKGSDERCSLSDERCSLGR